MDVTSKVVVAVLFLFLVFIDVYARCPPANQVRGPECRQDYDCRKGPCCPNWLGKKSCVNTAPFKPDSTDKYFGQQQSGAGVYCDGVKCTPYQVCKPDRFTGRLRCQSP